jgi:hypothetical protein
VLAVEKDYRFEGPDGPASLLDLFEGRRQLIVYRFFYEPGVVNWPEAGCPGCSMVADQVAHPAHLNTRDTALAFASRAPQERIARLETRMGWELIPGYTLTDDFDVDLGIDDWHGTNAFIRYGEEIYRTYLVSSRGDEAMGSTLELPRHHRSWSPGGVGGLAGGLPADPAVQVVAAPRRVRGGRRRVGAENRRGAGPARQAGGLRVRGRAVIAHIAGLPVEETLMPLVSGAGAGILLARVWALSFRGRPLLL